MRFILGLVLLCCVLVFGQMAETAKNKQAGTISKNGKHSNNKAKEGKSVAPANGENDVWYEIKAMRMDKKEAALPGYFYRDSYKTKDRRRGRRRRTQNRRRHYKKRRNRSKPHVAATEKPKQLKSTLDAAMTKKPQQLNFTRKPDLTMTEKHERLNFTTLDATMPKKPMQLNSTAI